MASVSGLLLIVLVGLVALLQGGRRLRPQLRVQAGRERAAGDPHRGHAGLLRVDRLRGLGNVAEEAQEPARNYPRALFLGLGIAGMIYLLVTFTVSAVVPTDQLASSDAPLVQVVELGPLGIPPKLLSFIALLAVANSALINMVMASRIVYGMARQGIVASALGRLLPNGRTPWATGWTTTTSWRRRRCRLSARSCASRW